ncbi:6,7-dimethyl-8-ribityllumazine synthase [Enterobacteriaceae endosymbiont of Neohaemonia nigricornis]|uniref:6,7-dimethyl-8-ribityllumazine synthase n=1 Tax=Enterobacteriaceae endosymbiont of Neohaemonia nigricornis TaxID=2675792 RepID=UPI001449EAAE|nr:6,7-dimethyl-8-ribityllumazine synthase [Enterobacteriaceae endosymbiont of Neohaemonia nigricornis]QJC30251.1 6,7-dimethyl-8-ribityllumazine synthase [Enterobacteriaceae endosymbiont of Neohaemonia nigricornis]
MKIISEGIVTKNNIYIAIIIARYNMCINKNLLNLVIDTLERLGIIQKKNITIIWVPGVYELSITTKLLIQKNIYDGIIPIGTIIKGQTLHHKYLAREIYNTISYLTIKYNMPITLCILTADSLTLAIEKSNNKIGNPGIESALTLLEMINIFKSIKLLKN